MTWGADSATGWVGTDWVEQIVLTLQGPDYYENWAYHRIPFDDDGVVQAFEEFGEVARTDGFVWGGRKRILGTPVAESMHPAFDDPPRCLLERQGSFEESFLPGEVRADLDDLVGVFPFPPADDTAPPDVLGAADLAALVTADEDTVRVLEFISSDAFGAEWAQIGGWLSPHRTFDPSDYPDDTTRQIAAKVAAAPHLVFDASDLMPSDVGAGTFWTGMVEWLNGKSSADTAADIEASWPN
jgi:alpha-glucoside transport system substrate-binding protein